MHGHRTREPRRNEKEAGDLSILETLARCAASFSRWALRDLFHRDAANFPGKIGLYLDRRLIAHAASNLECGSICVVGTNGKTTTTNLIANALACAHVSVCCNRTGANLDSGVASALLEQGHAQWAVLECDELWLVHVLPQLKSKYVLLLNLFRDQLDRAGEIELVQKSIIAALERSSETVLVYNADDPLCTAVARAVPNETIAFGIGESMNLAQNSVADAQICQHCSSPLVYDYRQYGQLGNYRCPTCEFKRPHLDWSVDQVAFSPKGMRFTVSSHGQGEASSASKEMMQLHAAFPGAYMVYNLSAVAILASMLGCTNIEIQQAIDDFSPRNGRLERLRIKNHETLLNLAKNPTGMNQNLRIALNDDRPFVLGIFINDKEADGHDVSWLWDVDFEELARRTDIAVFAGGIRKNDLQVRLKYAGVTARLIDSATDLVAESDCIDAACPIYAIANYTALPAVKANLEACADDAAAAFPSSSANLEQTSSPHTPRPSDFSHPARCEKEATGETVGVPTKAQKTQEVRNVQKAQPPLVIAHLFPKLLNLYGDGGNVTVLRKRLEWRGISVEVRTIDESAPFDLSSVDLVFLGGAPDREQEIASRIIMNHANELSSFIENGGVCLAICGGYQMLGRSWLLNGKNVPGLGIGAFETRRAGDAHDRLVGNITLRVAGIGHPVVGYENHAGRTYLDAKDQAFGRVISKTGHGNNDDDGNDGYLAGNLIGTYLHGPLLAKNPELADDLLKRALLHWRKRMDAMRAPALTPLDDEIELQANAFMACR